MRPWSADRRQPQLRRPDHPARVGRSSKGPPTRTSSAAGSSVVLADVGDGGGVGDDFIGHVVAVLAGVEDPPTVLEGPWGGGAEDPVLARVPVGGVDAGDLVVPVVAARCAAGGVDGGGGVP